MYKFQIHLNLPTKKNNTQNTIKFKLTPITQKFHTNFLSLHSRIWYIGSSHRVKNGDVMIVKKSSPKIRLGISVPNFWAAAAAGNWDSVIFSYNFEFKPSFNNFFCSLEEKNSLIDKLRWGRARDMLFSGYTTRI